MQLLEFLLVGLAAGWMMGKIRKGKSGYGLFMSLAIGAIGSFIGWFLIGFLRIESRNVLTELLMALTGAALFFFVTGSLTGKKKKPAEGEDE